MWLADAEGLPQLVSFETTVILYVYLLFVIEVLELPVTNAQLQNL